jgi:putative hydrolase of the HAD superfamily
LGFYYIHHSPKKTHLIDGAEDVLKYLKSRYSLHIITNGFEEVQWVKIDNCGLKKYFEVIVTSEMAKVKKPDPKIFHFAMDLAKAEANQSIMIGDNEATDIIGAQNAGLASILFAKAPPKETAANFCIDKLLKIKGIL